jgi:hypothetical protein
MANTQNERCGQCDVEWIDEDALYCIACGAPRVDELVRCRYCNEEREGVEVASTWQQWQCGACGNWNQRGKEELD